MQRECGAGRWNRLRLPRGAAPGTRASRENGGLGLLGTISLAWRSPSSPRGLRGGGRRNGNAVEPSEPKTPRGSPTRGRTHRTMSRHRLLFALQTGSVFGLGRTAHRPGRPRGRRPRAGKSSLRLVPRSNSLHLIWIWHGRGLRLLGQSKIRVNSFFKRGNSDEFHSSTKGVSRIKAYPRCPTARCHGCWWFLLSREGC